jgi:hypothetical protein
MQRVRIGKRKGGITVQSTVKGIAGPVHLVRDTIGRVQEASINSMQGSAGLGSSLKSGSITCKVHIGQM